MHKIRFQTPRHELTALPKHTAAFKEAYFKGRGGKTEGKGRGLQRVPQFQMFSRPLVVGICAMFGVLVVM